MLFEVRAFFLFFTLFKATVPEMNEAKFGRELASRPWPTNASVLHGAPNGDLLLTLHVCVNEL